MTLQLQNSPETRQCCAFESKCQNDLNLKQKLNRNVCYASRNSCYAYRVSPFGQFGNCFFSCFYFFFNRINISWCLVMVQIIAFKNRLLISIGCFENSVGDAVKICFCFLELYFRKCPNFFFFFFTSGLATFYQTLNRFLKTNLKIKSLLKNKF